MFYEVKDLIYISGIESIKSNKIKNINHLFFDCSSLEKLPDIYILNTKNIINMKALFYNFSLLKIYLTYQNGILIM